TVVHRIHSAFRVLFPPIAPQSRRLPARLGWTTPSLPESRWREPPRYSQLENRSADTGNFSIAPDRQEAWAAEVPAPPSATKPCWSDSRSSPLLKPPLAMPSA